MSAQRVNRNYDQLAVGDIIFCRNSMSVDAIRYLSITRSTSERNMQARIHPTLILHKDDATRVMFGVTMTSKRMSQIQSDKRQYFVNASTYIPGQQGVMIIAGFNRINGAGNPPPTVSRTLEFKVEIDYTLALSLL